MLHLFVYSSHWKKNKKRLGKKDILSNEYLGNSERFADIFDYYLHDGKGVIKALRANFPNSNIVAIDYDPGATRVNQENRIKLMLANARL